MKTIRMIIKGKVQGVFFRASAKKIADQLNISGWIRNLPDRNVEIMASSSNEAVEKFIGWCRQGPPAAEVKEVIVEELPEESFPGFRIKK
ncbi:MAG TPA: acylphosphatase [Chitinophagaceae bacterium]|nr:acylphosphatase [Chitinophagaceae bacterium]